MTCEFGYQKDLLIRDRIVFGVRNDRMKERLSQEVDLSLEKGQKWILSLEKGQFAKQRRPAN